eukprot:766842-Hanusia_phi.AAC.7
MTLRTGAILKKEFRPMETLLVWRTDMVFQGEAGNRDPLLIYIVLQSRNRSAGNGGLIHPWEFEGYDERLCFYCKHVSIRFPPSPSPRPLPLAPSAPGRDPRPLYPRHNPPSTSCFSP